MCGMTDFFKKCALVTVPTHGGMCFLRLAIVCMTYVLIRHRDNMCGLNGVNICAKLILETIRIESLVKEYCLTVIIFLRPKFVTISKPPE